MFVDNSILMFEQEIHNDECDLGPTQRPVGDSS